MWQDNPTPEHHCGFPWGPLRREEVLSVWKCTGCGMEFNVTIGGWHFWWSPVESEESYTTRKPGQSWGTLVCFEEQLCVVYPRVELKSRGKMPNGCTLGTSIDLHPDDIGERPAWIPDFPDGYRRRIAKNASSKDKEINILDDRSETKPKKKRWLF